MADNVVGKEWVLIGKVAVDSGQLMVCDPCYIEEQWIKGTTPGLGDGADHQQFSYAGACDKTNDPHLDTGIHQGGELCFKAGHTGVAVVFPSGFGDGVYPVYGRLVDGRVVEVRIVMTGEDEG